MGTNYQKGQREKAIKLINENSEVFYGGKGGGCYKGLERDFILVDREKNLYQPIQEEVIAYFKQNKIGWWGGKRPTGHALSSQVACVNHLFAVRKDKQAVLSLLKSVSADFVDVYEIPTDKYDPAYIQFESVSDSDHLNEGKLSRGRNCTSVDALIYAKHKDGTKWLIPIEWKYTEDYSNRNKETEAKSEKRKERYTGLINQSDQLKSENHDCYYFEPFYQLMRQTLWAEQMVKNRGEETIQADNYLHLHVVPAENDKLLKKIDTWRSLLKDDTKYRIISPEDFFRHIDTETYKGLIDYLTVRYWKD